MNLGLHYLSETEKDSLLIALAKNLRGFGEVSFAYAYGSFVEECPFRDLDVGLYLYPQELPDSKFYFEDKISQELCKKSKLTFPLDVRIINGASIAFQYHVIQGRLLMERSEDYRVRIVSHIIARYLDIKPVLEHHTKEAFAVEAEP